ncbi:MAG TPA: TetR family transcriptional regulator C-terminal domain-containing protein [Kaistella chaponensis]|nr:TetR family transcriptional regulator C-terminal domain-containing protein [Kaistella chaponensis]
MKNTDASQQKILELYSNYVLRNNKKPLNVFTFCEDHEISETDFYFYYANFEKLESDYLRFFMEETLRLIAEEENYHQQNAKHKMLSFYYTFFEQLTMNRSLVIYLLESDKNNLQNVKKLLPLKRDFQLFIRSLDISEPMMENTTESMAKIERLKNKGIEELYWGHFMATLKFWLDDTSSNFEKTDIFIEKSVDTSFEFLEVKPLKKLVDLGKFLFKEVKNNR